MKTRLLIKELLALREENLKRANLQSENILSVATRSISVIRGAKQAIKTIYPDRLGNLAAYYYWLSRIERRMVFELFFQRDGLSGQIRIDRVMTFLVEKANKALFRAIMKHNWKVNSVNVLSGRCARIRLDGLDGHKFYCSIDLLRACGLEVTENNSGVDDYEKFLIANAFSVKN